MQILVILKRKPKTYDFEIRTFKSYEGVLVDISEKSQVIPKVREELRRRELGELEDYDIDSYLPSDGMPL